MRGKVNLHFRYNVLQGITPAYAGKSGAPTWATAATGDHPRVCGEKRKYHCRYARRLGSPPRMRGKVLKQLIVDSVDGITPAYAGKRGGRHGKSLCRGDHPRVCGEKFSSRSSADLRQGSPPRMRGKVHFRQDRAHVVGITPAHAGKRPMMDSSAFSTKDHPRACGEKGKRRVHDDRRVGSPPPVRGKGGRTGSSGRYTGITPACAGKS